MRPKFYQCQDNKIADYVEKVLNLEKDSELNKVLQIAKESGTPPLQVTSFDARHLEVIARLAKPKKILEFGTLCGYSSVALARALDEQGMLYTCEKSPHHAKTASEVFEALNLTNKIKIVIGEALESLEAFSQYGPFDIIFLDAKKEDYPDLFEWCVTHLNKGGLLLADNVFALGYIQLEDQEMNEKLLAIVHALQKFNSMCANDPRLVTTILPTGEGLLAAIKC